MSDQPKAQFGLIGLGVMGSALARNIEDRGLCVAVWNHTPAVTAEFMAAIPGKRFVGAQTLQQLVEALERPRRILMMIKAGAPVDSMLDQLKPLLEEGDIVIDGGNSWYKDTQRREARMRTEGIEFVGAGVSGGESGARFGPSIMPGGSPRAWQKLRPVLEAIAAKTDSGPCVTHVGPDGAGHFVKMVHNGIEYGDMQIIAEAYDLLRKAAGMDAPSMADLFARWNHGLLESFLVELTARVLRKNDEETGKPLVDLIVDAAGQKGTGRWTMESALQSGVPIPTLTAALEAREMSALRPQRLQAVHKLQGLVAPALTSAERDRLVDDLEHAILASRICAYAQGMSLISAASGEQGWNVRLQEIARIWTGGCIIRAKLLDSIKLAYERAPELGNLLLDPDLGQVVVSSQQAWRRVLATAAMAGVPCPSMSASLSYFDSFRSAHLPQNLIQAQRDAFGAHTYQRVDFPERGFLHTDWPTT
ncbi:MAG: NADP-dependent phosphogluconate dehydrogenase [Deltaproteobacteria bacterium]|nr:NADP-dependent phosphogluconate dehydrogenase [Deltaproteobacteria bacterium]